VRIAKQTKTAKQRHIKSLRKGVWGITLLQKGFPHKSRRHQQVYGKEKTLSPKLKSAISRKSDKNKQVLKSSRHDGNKEIADFNLRKSAAIFANRKHECSQNRKGGENHAVKRRGSNLSPPYKHCAGRLVDSLWRGISPAVSIIRHYLTALIYAI
jgi:hypothetical protein